MSTVIEISGLSKKYAIRHQKGHRYVALRDVTMNKLAELGHHIRHPLSGTNLSRDIEDFWALKDVSFTVEKGERLGVIGRNGAGKTTLLKLLSRITEPSRGRIRIRGRVASLLEVGTGFHPELTGRENIFMNGVILGMTKSEIQKKFDEIVDFAGVEVFLDTPVKRYSSGMQARLGFSIAAHLEPDILIVDEVLAVGDVEFQKKCLGKMESVNREEGRTVLFVSHNMAAVASLTNQSVLLERGELVEFGNTREVIKTYLEGIRDKAPDTSPGDRQDRSGTGQARVVNIQIKDESGHVNMIPLGPGRKEIILDIECNQNVLIAKVAVGIYNADRRRVLWMDSSDQVSPFRLSRNAYSISILMREGACPSPGDYYINVALIGPDGMIDYLADASKITISDGDFFGSGKFPDTRPSIFIEHRWRLCSGGTELALAHSDET